MRVQIRLLLNTLESGKYVPPEDSHNSPMSQPQRRRVGRNCHRSRGIERLHCVNYVAMHEEAIKEGLSLSLGGK